MSVELPASRISGLLFAAGLGVAVVSGSGVAYADPTDSASSTSSSESSERDADTEPSADADDESADEDAVDPADEPGPEDESDPAEEPPVDEPVEEPTNDDVDDEREPTEEPVGAPDPVVPTSPSEPVTEADRAGETTGADSLAAESAVDADDTALEVEPPSVTAIPSSARFDLPADLSPRTEIISVTTDLAPTFPAVPPAFAAQAVERFAPPPPPVPTPSRLLAGLLSLVGAGPDGSVAPRSPFAPIKQLLEYAFAAWRSGHQYFWHNEAPTVTAELIDENLETGSRTYRLVTDDPEGDRVVVVVSQPPTHGQVQVNADGTLTYTADADLARVGYDDSFTVTASDQTYFHMHGPFNFGGHTTDATVELTVAATNKAPIVRVETVGETDPTTGEIVYRVVVEDPENDDTTYVITDVPDHGTFDYDAETDTYTYVPDPDYAHAVAAGGPDGDSFAVVATDALAASTSYVYAITVAPQNADPELTVAQPVVIDPDDHSVGYAVSSADADGDDLEYSIVSGPTLGELHFDEATSTYVYTPNYLAAHDILHGGPSTDSFVIAVTDGHGGYDEQTVTLDIEAQNRAMDISPPLVTLLDSNSIRVEINATNPDGDDFPHWVASLTTPGGLISREWVYDDNGVPVGVVMEVSSPGTQGARIFMHYVDEHGAETTYVYEFERVTVPAPDIAV